ncbi:MAG TPA: hypothetical protein ENL20_04955 [Candidatus Cloacimonetes bacterium]|nr:hypothetical protein [Candidatus Cloacimonadota bacterium]
MKNKEYIRRILIIIFLTNILAILSLPLFFKQSIGWIAGSFASIVNFLWLAQNVKKSIDLYASKAKLKSIKGSLLRYSFLIIFSLLIIYLIKPDIIIFGLGLLASQMAIFVNEIFERIRKNRYFRG